jgi:non-homologous end joining protein Ku
MAPNWKGFLRLSLVTCPVALYPATSESEKISFNQVNRQTGHRIKYLKVDADTGEEVPRAGKTIRPKERPKGENVVDLMEALRRSVGGASAETQAPKKPAKKSKKASAGQKEMLMPITGKKAAKEAVVKKSATRSQRKSA